MLLNIYYSKNLENKNKFQDFFLQKYYFKDEHILSGRLFDVCFFDIKNYQEDNESIDIVLIDEYLIDEIYENIPLQERFLNKWNENKKVIFVGLSENCIVLRTWSENTNFIRAFDKKNLFDFLYTEITHDILRFTLNKEKLNVFISHAKKDGRGIAKLIKEFIDNDAKLGNFFDETDIQNSDDWIKILKKEVNISLFLFIYSDNYAHTVWTQKEILLAKTKRVPIVGVDVLAKEDKRIFPYITNVKMVKLLHDIKHIEHLCDNNFSFQTEYNLRLIINALLKEALEHYFFLDKYRDKKDFLVLTRPPEVIDICKNPKTVLYPDPPLMFPEKNFLNEYKSGGKLLTPLMLGETNCSNKRVSISISESNNLAKRGLTIDHLNMLMIELARYLLIHNNILIYGGDLGYKREFNFTKLLIEILNTYNSSYENNNKIQKIINYSVIPFSDFIELNIKNKFQDSIKFIVRGEECRFTEIDKITKNLTKMREEITKEMDIKIAIGGKITGFMGFYPGVLEEVYLAIKSEKPTYLIGGFGGITEKIIQLINGKETEELTFKYQKEHTEKLKNFLNNASEKIEKEIEEKYNKIYNFLKGITQKNIFISDKEKMDDVISFIIQGV